MRWSSYPSNLCLPIQSSERRICITYIGTGCPEKLWMPCPWKCSRSGWMWLWSTWPSGGCPWPWKVGWNQIIFKRLSNPNLSMIPLFVDIWYQSLAIPSNSNVLTPLNLAFCHLHVATYSWLKLGKTLNFQVSYRVGARNTHHRTVQRMKIDEEISLFKLPYQTRLY